MKKVEFINKLRYRLSGLPEDELDSRLSFYEEMIDDMVDEGKSEDEAVAEIGGVEVVVRQIASETPLIKIVKEKAKPKRSLTGLEILLIVLLFPFWLPLLIVATVFIFLTFVFVWVFVIITYAIETALIGTSITGIVGFIGYLTVGQFNMTSLGFALVGLGAAILFIFACIGATKGTFKLSKGLLTSIKTSFMKKEAN